MKLEIVNVDKGTDTSLEAQCVWMRGPEIVKLPIHVHVKTWNCMYVHDLSTVYFVESL